MSRAFFLRQRGVGRADNVAKQRQRGTMDLAYPAGGKEKGVRARHLTHGVQLMFKQCEGFGHF